MLNINRLLNKEGWTGKEVGQALMASLIHDIKNKGTQYTPLFSQADLEKMERSLTNKRSQTTYAVYRTLYNSIAEEYDKAQTCCQQFNNGFFHVYTAFDAVTKADKVTDLIRRQPYVWTQKQYDRNRAKAIETVKQKKDSYYNALFFLLWDCLRAYEANNKDVLPVDIAKALDDTKKEPAKSKAICSSYNDEMRGGYILLPGVLKGDILPEEWEQALKQYILKSSMATAQGENIDESQAINAYARSLLKPTYELFYNGAKATRLFITDKTGEDPALTDKQLEDAVEDVLFYLDIGQIQDACMHPNNIPLLKALEVLPLDAEWNPGKNPAENLTAYDLLDYVQDSAGDNNINKKAYLNAFKKDYPALYKALDKCIRNNIPGAKDLKASQFYKDIFTYEELAEAGITLYADIIANPKDEDILEAISMDQNTGGIVIRPNPDAFHIDKNGDYKYPYEQISDIPRMGFDTLEYLDKTKQLDEPKAFMDILCKPALKNLYAYNDFIDIVADIYDIKELGVAKYYLSVYENQISSLNSLILGFYYGVSGDKETKEKMRELIKEGFPLTDLELLKPKEGAKEALAEKLKDLGYSSDAVIELIGIYLPEALPSKGETK